MLDFDMVPRSGVSFILQFCIPNFSGSALDPPCRWLIDLEGLRDVDICNAYADAQSTSYPGRKGVSR